jgi:hypothetical protein
MSIDKDYINHFDDILQRLKKVSGKGKQYEIAALLGFDKDSFAARKSRGSIPEKEIKLACLNNGWRYEWVMSGEGSARVDKFQQLASAVPVNSAQELKHDHPLLAEDLFNHTAATATAQTLEQQLALLGFNSKDIRQIQEWAKLSDEEKDEELKRICMQNLERGRF